VKSPFLFHSLGLAAMAALAAPASAQAQTVSATAPAAGSAAQTIVITGNPLGRDVATQAASVLSGDGLMQRRAGTLGETLDGLPGVSASAFGPNSSRPVIRGLDGDRVRLLDNGGASVDASSLSFDHASASDPLVTERIEVLRGPAALLYGGNATGGVVNSIDNRIPRSPAMAALSGRAELRAGGASNERSGALVLEGGDGRPGGGLAWHADGYGRQAGDQRVPRYTPVDADGVALDPSRRVRNSASRAEGGAVGAAWVAEHAFLGASAESTRSRYGVTVEPDVTIRMQRERYALAGEWRALPGALTQVSAQASRSQYRHEEVQGNGDVGTTFISRGDEVRLQAHHAAVLGLQGVFGAQAERLDFQALGAEAFVPATQTRSTAVFAVEELPLGAVTLNAGARVEQVSVASAGDAPGSAEAKFGTAARRQYTPSSLSLGGRLSPAPGWQLSASLGRTERAPAYYELFANGVHVATAAYESGNPLLGTERSRHAELGLAWTQGTQSFKANVFDTRFSRFISLDATGAVQTVPGAGGAPGSSLPVYAFRAVRAQMRGFELEGRTRLMQRPWTLDLSAGLDSVRGDNLDSHEALPRLAPRRLRLGLEAAWEGLHGGATLRQMAQQERVPASDRATPGYTLLDVWASGRVAWGDDTSWFAKLNNATDKLASNASAIATMRGLSPLPGRALTLGLRSRF
jgi:iron complex outermembrane receptor protein